MDGAGQVVTRRKLQRSELIAFFEKQASCTVVIEACGAAHHWVRVLTGLGHDVKLIAPEAVRFADKGYDAEGHRTLCRVHGVEPRIHKRKQPHGSGLGKRRWPVERTNAWLLENKRLGLRYDRLGSIVQTLLQAACILVVAPRLAREL